MQIIYQLKLVTFATIKSGHDQTISIWLLQVTQFFNLILFIMNIFVANLSFKMRDDQLRKVFEPHGEVESARIITDRNSGRSRGYGFVVMPNDTEAANAIKELNDMEVEGRKLIVKESEERSEPKRFTGRRE